MKCPLQKEMVGSRRWLFITIALSVVGLWGSRGLAQSPTLELSQLRFAGAGSQRTLTLQFSQPPAAVQSFVLTSPIRFVIDVRGPVSNVSPGTIPVQDAFLARVRTGVHRQRLRFVLDLQTNEIPKFSVEQQQGVVTATLTAPDDQSSEPFSQVLFTLPGRTASVQSVPSVVSPSIAAPPTQEAKAIASAQAPAATTAVEPKKVSPSEQKEKGEKSRPTATPALPKIEDTAKADKKQAPPSEHTKSEEPSTAGEKKVTPIEQASLQEKPNPLPQQSLVGKSDTEEKKNGPVEKLSVAKKPEPGESETGEQKPIVPEKAQASVPDSKAASSPQTPQEHFERGQVLYAKGEVVEAIVHWQETLRLAPETAKAHLLLGLALQHRGKTAEAISALQEAVRLTPGDAVAYIQLAQALETTGDVEAARAAYQKAQQLVPNSAYIYDRLGQLSAAQGKWGETIYAWRETVRLRPQSAAAYANLGEALEKVGKKEEAIAAYERALQLDPQITLATKIHQRVSQLRVPTP